MLTQKVETLVRYVGSELIVLMEFESFNQLGDVSRLKNAKRVERVLGFQSVRLARCLIETFLYLDRFSGK